MINPFSNPLYLLSPLVIAAITLGLAALVLLKSRWTLTAWIFSFIPISIALVCLLLFGMRSSPDVDQALVWERGVPTAVFCIYLFYYHFTLLYTNRRTERVILYCGYLLLVIALVLAPTDLFIKEMSLEYYGYAPVIGPLGTVIFISYLFFLGKGMHNLIARYRVSPSYEENNRLFYLAIAPIFPIAGAALDAFTNLPPAGMWGNLVFGILCSLVILKYHLLDIRIVVRKGLTFFLVSAAVAIPYVGLLYLLQYTFEPILEPWWVHTVIILLLAILLRPLYSWAQQFVDRLFYRDRYDYLRALQRFSHEAQSIANLQELGSTTVKLVSGALRTPSVCLLLPSGDKNGLVMVSSTGLENPPSGVVLRNISPLVKWLKRAGDILSSEQLDIVPQLQSFSLKEKNELERMGAKLYVPVKTRQGELSGILILGQKLSQQSYSGDDKRMLTAVSNQMAIALENARLYEETRQSERELREREAKYRELAESITDVFFAMNEELRYTYWNKASEELTGISAKDAVGKHFYDLFPDIEGTRNAEEMYLKVLRAKRPQYFINEYRIRDKDFVFEISAYPSKDGLSVFVKDITERKQAEEREKKLQQELNFSSRLASIGELAAGVAHEINNPLTGIIGFSQRLLRKSTDETTKIDLQTIYEEACRAAKVVENLRTFARRREPKKELVSIDDILQKALEMRIYEFKAGNIEVVTDLAAGLPQIMVDFHQIQQVFLNIIVNAEQAMTETNHRGKLAIQTQEHRGHIRITFTDDGPRIPSESLDKVFDPFFTTRGEKGGTGLGLSICHGIVTEHGGRIYARSKLGKGTTFFVELPLTTEKIGKDKVPEQEPRK